MNGIRRMSSSVRSFAGSNPSLSYRRRWKGLFSQARSTVAFSLASWSFRSCSFGRVSPLGFQ
jgi:hypothetical protein